MSNVSKKKKGRKPSGKLFSEASTNSCVLTCFPIDDDEIDKIVGKTKNKTNKTKPETSDNIKIINPSSMFLMDNTEELEYDFKKVSNELETLKKKYIELEEKYKRYEYLETIVSDNGVIDKEHYTPITMYYDTKMSKWSPKTDLWCSWCCHGFDTVPLGLPETYNVKTKQFTTRSCFCSFNCAHAYNISLNDNKVWTRYAHLNRMKSLIFRGTDIEKKRIISASPREMLKEFGGKWSIEKFRNNKIFIPKEYKHLLPPSIPYFTVIEEIPAYFVSSANTSITDKLRSKHIKPAMLKSKKMTVDEEIKNEFI